MNDIFALLSQDLITIVMIITSVMINQIMDRRDIHFWYAVRDFLVQVCDCCKRHNHPCPVAFFLWRVNTSWGVTFEEKWRVYGVLELS
jgi:hypothetical protein